MSANFTYNVALRLDNKGYIVAVDTATGKTTKLDRALDGVGKTSTNTGSVSAAGMLKFAAAAGAAYLAVDSLKNLSIALTRALIESSANFEDLQTRLETFTGSAEVAEKRMVDLLGFSARTPFLANEIIETEIILRGFGGTALATNDNLTMIGDAASASGQRINELSGWFGRAYTAIQEGKPLGEVFQKLREIGLVTPGVSSEIEKLQKQGADATVVWGKFTSQFDRTAGSMDRQSKTYNGLVSTMEENWDNLLRTIGNEGPLDVAKVTIKEITDAIVTLNSSMDDSQEVGKAIAESFILVTEAAFVFLQAGADTVQIFAFLKNLVDKFVLSARKGLIEVQKLAMAPLQAILWLLDDIDNYLGTGKTFEKGLEKIAQANKIWDDISNELTEDYRKQEESAQKLYNTTSALESKLQILKSSVLESQKKSLEKTEEIIDKASEVVEKTETLKEKTGSGGGSFFGNLFAIPIDQQIGFAQTAELLERANQIVQKSLTSKERLEQDIQSTLDLLDALREKGQENTEAFLNLEEALGRMSTKLNEETNENMTETLLTLQDIANDIEQSFTDMFASIISGSASAKDAMKFMYQSIILSFAQYISERITKMIFADGIEEVLAQKSNLRATAGAQASMTKAAADTHAWTDAIPWIGVALGIALVAKMLSDMRKAKSQSQTITGYAEGGVINPVSGGQLILAGEARQREIIAPETNFIEWADQIANRNSGGGGGPSLAAHIHGNVFTGEDLRAIIRDEFDRMMRRAAR